MGPSSCRSMEIRNESVGSFSDRDFPSITKIGESSCRCKSLRQLKRDEQGFAGPPLVGRSAVWQPVREEDFISRGMYRLAKSEDC
jgi:hypothetical protein